MSPRAAAGQILVIEPAVRFPNLDCFNELALRAPFPLAYHLPALYGLESLDQIEAGLVRGVILLGSAASVNDGAPWQAPLSRRLVELWSRGLPVLGICYGHQLIAHLFGGRVGLAFGGEKRRAIRRVRVQPGAPSWVGEQRELELCVSHREAVLECPPCLRAFAESDEVAVEAIAHLELPVFGFQAHLEATPLWLARHGLATDRPEARLRDSQRLLAGFFDLVAAGP